MMSKSGFIKYQICFLVKKGLHFICNETCFKEVHFVKKKGFHYNEVEMRRCFQCCSRTTAGLGVMSDVTL